MKDMKIISDYPELRGETYDTVEACQEAENKVDAAKAQKAEACAKQQSAVEAARKDLVQARKDLSDAEEEAKKIAAEANAKIRDVVTPARSKVREADVAFRKALAEYNKANGPYRVTAEKFNDPVVEDLIDLIFGNL